MWISAGLGREVHFFKRSSLDRKLVKRKGSLDPSEEEGFVFEGKLEKALIPIVRRSTFANPSLLTNAPTPNGSISNSLRIRKKGSYVSCLYSCLPGDGVLECQRAAKPRT